MSIHPYTRLFPKNVAPTVNDDVSFGYEIGDTWIDTAALDVYHCVDNSVGAAVWSAGGGGGGGGFTQEQIEDFVGAMFSGNTETGITADYDDATGKINLVVTTLGSNSFVINDIPAGTVNGTNKVFTTTYPYIPNSLQVFRDGQLLNNPGDYAETTPGSGIFTTVNAPAVGSIMQACYQQVIVTSGNADTVDGYHAEDLIGVYTSAYHTDQSGTGIDTYGVLGGTINGTNLQFIVSSGRYTSGSLRVYLNGQLQVQGVSNDWYEGNPILGTFYFNTAPVVGDIITAVYHTTNTFAALGSNSFTFNETPTGATNGSNTLFTCIDPYVAGGLQVFRDGQLMKPILNYTETNPELGTFTMVTAPNVGTVMLVHYQQQTDPTGNADTLDGRHWYDFADRQASLNGWNLVGNDWVRLSNSSFQMTKNTTLTYRKGAKLRWKEGGNYKYGVILSSSFDGTLWTTVNLVPTTDHILVGSSPTDTYISYELIPDGFPTVFNFSSTIDGTTGGAWGVAPTLNSAQWSIAGGLGCFKVDITINNVGTMTGTLRFTNPWTTGGGGMGVGRENASTGSMLQAIIGTTTTTILAYNNGTILTAGWRVIVTCNVLF